MKKWIAFVAALTMAGCLAEHRGPTAPETEGPFRATSYDSEILHPDGNSIYGTWWRIVPSGECGGSACCYQPCDTSWDTLDEDLADAWSENRYIATLANGAVHQLTFESSSGPSDLTVSDIDFEFGRIGFDPSYHPYIQTLTITAYADGNSLGTDYISCFQGAPCDSADTTWTSSFTGLSLSQSDLNTLELKLEATGIWPGGAFMEVHHVEAHVSYGYPEAPVLSNLEIYTQVPCNTAYVRFQVDSSGTTGKVNYGATNCSSSSVNTTVVGDWHYASFDVSGLPTKFYWQAEATYQGETTAGSCNLVKKNATGIYGCPAPTWWP
jgi:hypothetical protein